MNICGMYFAVLAICIFVFAADTEANERKWENHQKVIAWFAFVIWPISCVIAGLAFVAGLLWEFGLWAGESWRNRNQ